MKTTYDTSLQPPAPFVPVRLASLADRSERIAVQAKIDTGADLTVIPARLVEQLQLMPAGEIEVEGFLLGRDVLNRLRVLLDGPALTAEILMS